MQPTPPARDQLLDRIGQYNDQKRICLSNTRALILAAILVSIFIFFQYDRTTALIAAATFAFLIQMVRSACRSRLQRIENSIFIIDWSRLPVRLLLTTHVCRSGRSRGACN